MAYIIVPTFYEPKKERLFGLILEDRMTET